MQDWDALKYFLINLGLHNLVLVLLAAGLGVLLGRLLWARSAQGLVQLRERVAAEGDRAKDAERELEKYEELREQLGSREGEGGAVVINSPELEEEVAALRERSREADATLKQMMLANQALEGVVKNLEEQKATWEDGGTTGREHDEAEVAALRAEIEVLRGESSAAEKERDELMTEVASLKGDLEKAATDKQSKKGRNPENKVMTEQLAALEQQLLEAKNERKQVEEASGVLRQELYGMRHKLEEVEKRETLEEGLDSALHDAEQRLTRLQAEVTASSRRHRDPDEEDPPEETKVELPNEETPQDEKPEAEEPADEEVVRLTVEDEVDDDDLEDEEPAILEPEPPAGADPEAHDDLTRLRGVGAVLAKRLHEAGVHHFLQIAEWTEDEVEEMSKKLSLRNRVKSGDWQGQARALDKKAPSEED